MAELDLSRDIYRAAYTIEDSVDVGRNLKDDNTIVLDFGEINVIIDDFQALDMMRKLAAFFNYKLVDLDA
ncbi:hypothetical protein [Neisseria musculi]|uniref:Uncharacterized protein n=1 Tax=Neisseria musculi TaxID=1815583 RepID=A0A7H1M921_9NEIS|nr:hypothetical protein [Neisseria musculi]QNT58136.1 hypothetical protein H7A79_2649 [Neisseria musculi]QNT58208.1 hypothetical protein H7A79_2228 [Neisseria musculi]QNT59333.1 hypothetical protein H7A79_1803 [Neisseria musculi]QNT59635.1 hypothetical protein H7A79_0913 [Neisseria musculi]